MQNKETEEELLIQEMADLLKIFGDYSRIKIIETIMDTKFPVNEIASKLGMTISAVSHHLRILRQAKLVIAQRDGKEIYYIVADKHVKEIYDIAKTHIEEFKK